METLPRAAGATTQKHHRRHRHHHRHHHRARRACCAYLCDLAVQNLDVLLATECVQRHRVGLIDGTPVQDAVARHANKDALLAVGVPHDITMPELAPQTIGSCFEDVGGAVG
jgi:hypothetical protein